ncbi:YihY/virulence factor BrkB family protein [Halocalculus aciditolerans]|uniref:YihY family inner membrane protein n=1 Tax=Halocalculus aciditolerans TaxID=1383812 RepID=A0A830F2F0_9EURY|nr:YihY/virulence factor BrkB family protein [Halocalculus aciditolerans]GGL48713.1 hypothetical protein GCM10009039_03620 [Halocalculus aciditolerans]
MTSPASLLDTGRAVVAEARDDQVTFLAAAVAYYGFVSLVPLLLLTIAVGTAVGASQVADAVVGATGAFLTPTGEALVRTALENAAGRGTATVAGALLLLWSGLRLFRGLDQAFADIYGKPNVEPLLQQVADGLLVLGSIAVAVVAMAALGVALPVLSTVSVPPVVGSLLLVVVLAVVFVPVYYIFPDVELDVEEAIPGAAFAAVGWTLFAEAFRVYAGYVGDYQLYGILGAAILVVTFLYIAGIVIMVGAVLNAVLAGRTEETDEPDDEVEPPEAAPDLAEMAGDLEAIRRRLDEKTVDRDDLERDLEGYVDARVRRNHARGWGPYLVLLYGTVMTLGAFFWLGGWASVAAMVVIWLSTLGLFTLMVLFGAGLNAAGMPGKVASWVNSRR